MTRLSSFFICFLVALTCAKAAPLPPNGGYAAQGMPAFIQGSYQAIDNSGAITIVPGQGSVSQARQTNSSITTVITNYNTFECIDANNLRAEGTFVSYPSGLSTTWCGLVFANATHLITKVGATLLGQCPDSLLTPPSLGELFGEFTIIPNVIPASNFTTCSNSAAVPNLTTLPPSPPSPSTNTSQPVSPGPVNQLQYPGSAPPQYGLWASPGVFMYQTQTGMGGARFDGSQLRAQLATFTSYQCTAANSFYQTFDLTEYDVINPMNPITTTSMCLSGSRNNTSGQLTEFMTSFGPCPAAVQAGPTSPGVAGVITTTLVGSIPGNPSTVCPPDQSIVTDPPIPQPAPSPSPDMPSPSTTPTGKACTWRGIWNIAPSKCPSKHLTFQLNTCSNHRITLQSTKNNLASTTFGLAHSWTSGKGADSNTINAVRKCPNNKISNISGAKKQGTALDMTKSGIKWSLIPRSSDCTVVNLMAKSGPNKGKYLEVSSNCNDFMWTKKDGAHARFKLNMLSQILGR